jgi:phenylacetic acid degradation operon negative regulatory protein
LLLTVLGEYVLPEGGRAWSDGLIEALTRLGIDQTDACHVLSKAGGGDWLTRRKASGQVAWELTNRLRRLLEEGAQRIYSHGRLVVSWDGRWVILFLAEPPDDVELAERLRVRLTWAGLGEMGPGSWVGPRPGIRLSVKQVLEEFNLAETATLFVGRFEGDAEDMVKRVWDLDWLAAQYDHFIDEVSSWHPRTYGEVFVCQTRLVHEWRHFPFIDPDLPKEFLPPDWSGARAADTFHRLRHRWRPHALTWWEKVQGIQ